MRSIHGFILASALIPTSLAFGVDWQGHELDRFHTYEDQASIYSLKAVQELFDHQQIQECGFEVGEVSLHTPPGGAYESVKLAVYRGTLWSEFTLNAGLTLGYLADHTFQRSNAPVAVDEATGKELYQVSYRGDLSFWGRDILRIEALVDAHDQIHYAAGVRDDVDYVCHGLNLGVICLGIGGEYIAQTGAEELFECGNKELKNLTVY